MDKGRIAAITQQMEALPNERLLEIWNANDRNEWSAEAFEAILQVLIRRGVSLPPQSAADSATPDVRVEPVLPLVFRVRRRGASRSKNAYAVRVDGESMEIRGDDDSDSIRLERMEARDCVDVPAVSTLMRLTVPGRGQLTFRLEFGPNTETDLGRLSAWLKNLTGESAAQEIRDYLTQRSLRGAAVPLALPVLLSLAYLPFAGSFPKTAQGLGMVFGPLTLFIVAAIALMRGRRWGALLAAVASLSVVLMDLLYMSEYVVNLIAGGIRGLLPLSLLAIQMFLFSWFATFYFKTFLGPRAIQQIQTRVP